MMGGLKELKHEPLIGLRCIFMDKGGVLTGFAPDSLSELATCHIDFFEPDGGQKHPPVSYITTTSHASGCQRNQVLRVQETTNFVTLYDLRLAFGLLCSSLCFTSLFGNLYSSFCFISLFRLFISSLYFISVFHLSTSTLHFSSLSYLSISSLYLVSLLSSLQ